MTAKTPQKAAAKAAPVTETEQPTTATYVVGSCPVLHNGKAYQPGFDIELSEAEAARLGTKVRPAPTDPEPPLE